MTTRLLARADDLGSFHAANRAILDCCDNGVVRNASIMVPAPCFREAADMFRERSDICLGIHGTITCEWNEQRWRPILPPEKIPSLVDPDGFLSRDCDAILKRGVRFSEVISELQAQLDNARKAGLDIKYADNHMAFGWLFEGTDDSHRLTDALDAWAKSQGIVWDGWGSRHALTWPDIGEGPREEQPARFAAFLRAAPEHDYVMITHPSYAVDDILAATYGNAAPGHVAQERDLDRRMFMEQSVVDAVREKNISLIRYDQLATGQL